MDGRGGGGVRLPARPDLYPAVIEAAYFQPAPDDAGDIREAPLAMLAPLLALGFACLYFGIDTELTVGVAKIAALSLLGGYL